MSENEKLFATLLLNLAKKVYGMQEIQNMLLRAALANSSLDPAGRQEIKDILARLESQLDQKSAELVTLKKLLETL